MNLLIQIGTSERVLQIFLSDFFLSFLLNSTKHQTIKAVVIKSKQRKNK